MWTLTYIDINIDNAIDDIAIDIDLAADIDIIQT